MPRRPIRPRVASSSPATALHGGHRVVSLDPGARHFQMWYDPEDGAHGELLASTTSRRTPVVTAMAERQRRTDHKRARCDKVGQVPPAADDDAWFARQRGARADRERARLRDNAVDRSVDREHRKWLRLR